MLHLAWPDDLPLTDAERNELEQLAMEALMVRLYALGRIASGRAAQVLGLSRWAFLDLLGEYNVSFMDDSMDSATEADHT